MILIKNAKILSEKGITDGNILIEENRISKIGETSDKSDVVIDADGLVAIPGLFNTHTHAAMTIFRGYAEDMELHEWLTTKIWPAEAKLDYDAVYWGTKLACVEMLKNGVTFFNDMYFFPSAIAKAAEEAGIRACVSSAFFDFHNKDILEESLKRVEKELKELRNFNVLRAIAPHAVYTVSLEGLKISAEIAEREDMFIHFHLAETKREVEEFKAKNGKGIVEALDEIGFLSRRLLAAHCVWLEENEIEILAKKGVSVAHCPTSNMKLCVGKAMDFAKMREKGLNVCLATDGAASNNELNIFREMKIAALLQKFYYNDPTRVKAEEIFKMATENAAKAFNLKAGCIKEGYLADIVLLDLKTPPMQPCHSIVANVVYSSCKVSYVIVDGKIVVEDGQFEGEEEIIEKASKEAARIVS